MSKSYKELREEEKQELRSALYWGGESCTEYDELSEEDKKIVDEALDPTDIPEEVMLSAFGHYSFVDDDFFCNIPEEYNYAGFPAC